MAVSQIVNRHFGRKTLNTLAKKGIEIVGITSIPDDQGSFLNPRVGYFISDKGCGKTKTFREVMEIAENGSV